MSGKEIFVSRGGMPTAPVEEWIQFEAFFSEMEKSKGQEILVSTFKENTTVKSWELREQGLTVDLYGKIQEREDSPVMVLRQASLGIFENEDSWERGQHDLYFRNRGVGRITCEHNQGLYFDLTSEYHRWLVKIISEVASKVNSVLK